VSRSLARISSLGKPDTKDLGPAVAEKPRVPFLRACITPCSRDVDPGGRPSQQRKERDERRGGPLESALFAKGMGSPLRCESRAVSPPAVYRPGPPQYEL
jgi:hypothetical protein